MIQENRSFDNLFATFPKAEGTRSGKTPNGTVALTQHHLLEKQVPNYLYHDFLTDWDNGKMDGFANVPVGGAASPTYAYQYVNPAEIKPYWNLARQYVLADHMFQTQGSASFTSHQDLIAGGTAINSTESVIDAPTALPWGCDAAAGTTVPLITTSLRYIPLGPFPCLKYQTLANTLDAKGIKWTYYCPQLNGGDYGGEIWDPFEAIKAVRYGPDWHNVVSPETTIFTDIAGGKLSPMSWVVPDFQNSDHAGTFGRTTAKDTGPSWVASVVNAVGKSQYWNSTVIVVVWDDWGGFYDHVPPPFQDKQGGVGFRVPMIVISPYAKKNYIAKKTYEFGSVVRFIEDTFGLPSLNTTDATSRDFGPDVLNFSQPPRKFVPVAVKYSQEYFEHQRPSGIPVDTE